MHLIAHFLKAALPETFPCNVCSPRWGLSNGFCLSCYDAVRAFVVRRKELTRTTSKQHKDLVPGPRCDISTHLEPMTQG